MASTTMIETVTITRPLKPTELARRMIGERPSPVPPTRELWPRPQQQPLSVSTLHIAYMQEEPPARRITTLPAPQPPPQVPIGRTRAPPRPQLCTIGTNTDPPPTIISKLRKLVRREPEVKVIIGHSIRRINNTATFASRDLDHANQESTDNPTRRALKSIRNVISFKNKIAPDSEIVESPKIVYDTSKPGDRMNTTFGKRQNRSKWCKMPSKTACTSRLRSVGDWCMRPYQRAPKRRHSQPPPRLQMTQVIALICGLLVVILMVLGLASADWLMAAGWRQGLFMHCIEPQAQTPLPFDIVAQPGCYAARPATYIKAAAGLCVATLFADVCGALLTGLGLRASDHRAKFRYYRFAVLAMALALMCILIALVIYPVCFAAELNLGNRSVWEFGWAYGVGWGAAIFLFGAVILLLCDKESEELYYKERKVVTGDSSAGRP